MRHSFRAVSSGQKIIYSHPESVIRHSSTQHRYKRAESIPLRYVRSGQIFNAEVINQSFDGHIHNPLAISSIGSHK